MRSPDPLAATRGPTFKAGEETREERSGWEGIGGKGKEGKGRWEGRGNVDPPVTTITQLRPCFIHRPNMLTVCNNKIALKIVR